MKKTKLALATTGICLAMFANSAAQAAAPTVSGQIGARIIDRNNLDREVEAYDMRLGFKGVGKYGNVTALYQLEIDYTGSANDSAVTSDAGDEIQIRNARLLFPTKYGTFVIAPKSPSSQFSVLYGAVDIFETNGANADNGTSRIFDQGQTSTHVLAWASPKKAGFKGLLSYLTGADSNGVDADYTTWWLDWEADKEGALSGLRAAVGQVFIDKKAIHAAATEQAVRTAASIGYKRGSFYVGATHETYDFDGFGAQDRQNTGIVASYTQNGYTLGVGQFNRDFDAAAMDTQDNSGTVISIKKQVDKDLMFFLESGDFDLEDQSSVSLGAKLSF